MLGGSLSYRQHGMIFQLLAISRLSSRINFKAIHELLDAVLARRNGSSAGHCFLAMLASTVLPRPALAICDEFMPGDAISILYFDIADMIRAFRLLAIDHAA